MLNRIWMFILLLAGACVAIAVFAIIARLYVEFAVWGWSLGGLLK